MFFLSTLRNGISWDSISCSTNLMVLERDAISLLMSSIFWFIMRFFWSSSSFKSESLAASCSFRKLWRASNSSLICVSVCSAWFWKEARLMDYHYLHTLALKYVQSNIWYWCDWWYLDMLCHFFTDHSRLLVQLQFVFQRLQRIL